MRSAIEANLSSKIDSELVRVLLDAYLELKEHYYLGKHRPAELEGGRFCEVALRCFQQLANGKFIPLDKKLDQFDLAVKALENGGNGQAHESIRIHGPRLLVSIYGIRTRRNVGHVNGDVNPNFADSTLVMTVCDWVLAELVRITFQCNIDRAQAMVDDLLQRKIPMLEEFGEDLKILDPTLSVPDRILTVLYKRGKQGADVGEVKRMLKIAGGGSFSSALSKLEHDRAFIHRSGNTCWITTPGRKHIEENVYPRN